MIGALFCLRVILQFLKVSKQQQQKGSEHKNTGQKKDK